MLHSYSLATNKTEGKSLSLPGNEQAGGQKLAQKLKFRQAYTLHACQWSFLFQPKGQQNSGLGPWVKL